VAPVVVLLIYQHEWLWARHAVIAVFAVMAASDYLDGYLARHRGQITRLGRFLDPLADKLLIISTVILLATGTASVPAVRLMPWVAVVIVAKDLWVVVGFLVIFLFTGHLQVSPSRAGKLCTVVQLAMVLAILAAPDVNGLLAGYGAGLGSALARLLCYAAAGSSVLAVISYTRMGMALLTRAEQHEKSGTYPARLGPFEGEQRKP
jgi:CDP-diacylglycerol--glycerol-3-phosphate 3-phosphatidyltransferase